MTQVVPVQVRPSVPIRDLNRSIQNKDPQAITFSGFFVVQGSSNLLLTENEKLSFGVYPDTLLETEKRKVKMPGPMNACPKQGDCVCKAGLCCDYRSVEQTVVCI